MSQVSITHTQIWLLKCMLEKHVERKGVIFLQLNDHSRQATTQSLLPTPLLLTLLEGGYNYRWLHPPRRVKFKVHFHNSAQETFCFLILSRVIVQLEITTRYLHIVKEKHFVLHLTRFSSILVYHCISFYEYRQFHILWRSMYNPVSKFTPNIKAFVLHYWDLRFQWLQPKRSNCYNQLPKKHVLREDQAFHSGVMDQPNLKCTYSFVQFNLSVYGHKHIYIQTRIAMQSH